MDRSNHVFLFLSHSVSAQIIREYGNISSAIVGMRNSFFLYHDRRKETPPSLPRHKLYLFSDESLSKLIILGSDHRLCWDIITSRCCNSSVTTLTSITIGLLNMMLDFLATLKFWTFTVGVLVVDGKSFPWEPHRMQGFVETSHRRIHTLSRRPGKLS